MISWLETARNIMPNSLRGATDPNIDIEATLLLLIGGH